MGGQRIDDHAFWAGKGSKESVFPMGSKMKQTTSAEGAASVSKYEDTTEAIRSAQVAGAGKAKGRPLKTGYRY